MPYDAGERFFDPKINAMVLNVLPGQFATSSKEDEVLATILGSCVSACVRDPVAKIGGLNHFLLAKPTNELTSSSNRYGSFAMEQLINTLLKMGSSRQNLEFKLFGGADLFQNSFKVGTNNVDFVHRYLRDEGFRVTAEDLGGMRPRRIFYWPTTGRVIRHMVAPIENDLVKTMEEKYKEKIEKEQNKVSSGDVELF